MSDLSGLSQVIFAIVALVTAISSAYAAWHARQASAKVTAVEGKVDSVDKKVDVATEEIHVVKTLADGMTTKLVAATKLAGESKGRDDQRAIHETEKAHTDLVDAVGEIAGIKQVIVDKADEIKKSVTGNGT